MDSSRGGPLSTLLLMLPLIVVPTLMVLRPSAPDSGFAGGDVAAGEEDDFLSGDEDFESMFNEGREAPPAAGSTQTAETDLLDMGLGDFETSERSAPQPPRTAQADRRQQRSDARPSSAPAARRTPDLSRWGVSGSVWFTPGDSGQVVGFAAFVPPGNDSVRYRFAAIGQSDTEVVEDVIRQIEEWQTPDAASLRRRAD